MAQLFGTSVLGFWNISKALGACAGTQFTPMTEVYGTSWSPVPQPGLSGCGLAMQSLMDLWSKVCEPQAITEGRTREVEPGILSAGLCAGPCSLGAQLP